MHQTGRAGLPLSHLPSTFPGLVLACWSFRPFSSAVLGRRVRVHSPRSLARWLLFSWISARRGGLSTALEAGVPEAILWMQSGHAADVSARRYISLRSPKLLYRTWEAFRV